MTHNYLHLDVDLSANLSNAKKSIVFLTDLIRFSASESASDTIDAAVSSAFSSD